jgi:hypothetical protein
MLGSSDEFIMWQINRGWLREAKSRRRARQLGILP